MRTPWLILKQSNSRLRITMRLEACACTVRDLRVDEPVEWSTSSWPCHPYARSSSSSSIPPAAMAAGRYPAGCEAHPARGPNVPEPGGRVRCRRSRAARPGRVRSQVARGGRRDGRRLARGSTGRRGLEAYRVRKSLRARSSSPCVEDTYKNQRCANPAFRPRALNVFSAFAADFLPLSGRSCFQERSSVASWGIKKRGVKGIERSDSPLIPRSRPPRSVRGGTSCR
jgi:hypothetical protein